MSPNTPRIDHDLVWAAKRSALELLWRSAGRLFHGYVGSRLTPHLLGLGHHVRVIDLLLYTDAGLTALRKMPGYPEWSSRFELVQGDIRDEGAVKAAMKDIDVVIHLAAISNDPTGEIDEALTRQVNFDAVGLLLAVARQAGVAAKIERRVVQLVVGQAQPGDGPLSVGH